MSYTPVSYTHLDVYKRQLLDEYDIQTAEDIQDALKDLLGGTIKEMMEDVYKRQRGKLEEIKKTD